MSVVRVVANETIEIDQFSPSGLCVLCDNAVEEYDVGIVIKDRHAYLAHAMCINTAHDEQLEEEPE